MRENSHAHALAFPAHILGIPRQAWSLVNRATSCRQRLCPCRRDAQDYEIWALDQGTNIVHIYNAKLEEVGRIDMGAQGVRVPHMIHFTSDHAYASSPAPLGGRLGDPHRRSSGAVAVLKTGRASHMAVVKPDDSGAIVDVIGDPADPRSGRLVEIRIDKQKGEFALGRTLVIAEDPLIRQAADKFASTRAICHEYSADGRFAYVTLGPLLKDGGLVVLDTQSFALAAAFPVTEIRSTAEPWRCRTRSTSSSTAATTASASGTCWRLALTK